MPKGLEQKRSGREFTKHISCRVMVQYKTLGEPFRDSGHEPQEKARIWKTFTQKKALMASQ